MAYELKPCPFCGNPNPKIVGNGIGDYYVLCEMDEDTGAGCGARTSDVRCEGRQFAAERWNQRAIPKTCDTCANKGRKGNSPCIYCNGVDGPGLCYWPPVPTVATRSGGAR